MRLENNNKIRFYCAIPKYILGMLLIFRRMKQFKFYLPIILLLLFFQSFSNAQHILNSGNKYGLSAPDGTFLLPLEYDTVYQAKSKYQSSVWICSKNEKYGIFNFSDQWFSGIIFDEIKADRYSGIITMRQGDKWGFMTLQGGEGGASIRVPRHKIPHALR